MVKRLVSCLLAMVMAAMMVLTASAEDDFTLRNGVQFGDTMDQVRAKETLGWDTTQCTDTTLWTMKGTVAGIGDVQIAYFFDENGKLTEVKWELPSRDYADSSDLDYEKLYKAFVQKYGSTLGYTGGDCYIITGKALEGAATMYLLYDMFDMYGDMRDYAEWDHEFGEDDHVKIEIAQFVCGESYLEAQYFIFVGYKYFTDADLQNAMNEKQEENQAVMDDI